MFELPRNKGTDQFCGYREADLRVFAYASYWFSHEAAQIDIVNGP